MIDDEKIIEMFFERSEQGIRELDIKYGKVCHNLSYHIVGSRQDAEECVNDAYLGAWNAIPPARPNPLLSYIVKIVRNISLKIYWRKEAAKRSSHYTIALEEIEACIADQKTVEDEIEARELARIIEDFLDTLTVENRVIFMLYAFIDRVEVHEATGGRTVYRQQNIDIYFNFIGNYYPPVETVSEEERIAAIEAEQLRKKQEKAKRAAEVQKQKKAALMKAVEAGDPEAIAEYERKLALQRERNHRRQQKIKEAREADPAYIAQMEEKERLQREKLLEAERKRTERANRQKKLSRKELKEAAKTDPKAAEEWQALKEKEAVARQRKKEREEERMAADPEYAAMMAERKAEYTRTRTAKRQAEREALVELAKTDEEAAKKLAEMRKYQSQATVRSYQKMKADAEAGDPDAIKRYETTLAKRREEYHRKKGA